MRGQIGLVTDRGVSEVIAFVLVFAIIMGSIGIVYAVGFPAMLSYTDSEQTANAERAFDASAENFNDVLRYSAIEERSSEITLRGGTLETGESTTTITINVTGVEHFETVDPEDGIELGELVYSDGDRSVHYEGGAVFRSDDSGAAVVKPPRIRCDIDPAFISIMKIDSDEQNLASAESQEITVTEQSTETHEIDGYPTDIEGDLEEAWSHSPLESDDCGTSESIILRVTIVDVDF